MNIIRELNEQFNPVVAHVQQTYNSVNASGVAVLVIHNDKIVAENYWGSHSAKETSRRIQEDSQFHVASVRKSYIGYATAYAVYSGAISSLDDEITLYIPGIDSTVLKGTTIRHLITHSHGLKMENGRINREFKAGEKWAYRGIGVDLLTQIIVKTTGQTVAQILDKQVFEPLGFRESGWYARQSSKLVDVIREHNHPHWTTSESTAGDKMNMYVSARELAYWGYLHLKKGFVNREQIVPKEMIMLSSSVQSPEFKDADHPRNGFLWFVQDLPAKRTEIGEFVPAGSFQILGYTGVALLVIPKHDFVAVRMFNSFGSPEGFDYLADIRSFGNISMQCLSQ